MLATFDELRRYGVEPAALTQQASPKRAELARLYQGYCQRLRGSLDEVEELRLATELLRDGRPGLAPDLVLADGFYDFAPLEEALLLALAQRAAYVVVTLPEDESRPDVFGAPMAARQRLGQALDWEPIHLSPAQATREGESAWAGRAIATALFSAAEVEPTPAPIRFFEAPSLRAEAQMVAREARRLLDEGYSASDIAIVCRRTQPYLPLLKEACQSHGIPLAWHLSQPLSWLGSGRWLGALLRLLAGEESPTLIEQVLDSTFVLLSSQAQRQVRGLATGAGQTSDGLLARLLNNQPEPSLRSALDALAEGRSALQKATQPAQMLTAVTKTLSRLGTWQACVPSRWDDSLAAQETISGLQTGLALIEPAATSTATTQANPAPTLLADNYDLIGRAAGLARVQAEAEGVALLTAEEACPETFRVVFLCGLAHDSFPRLSEEDPLLPDADRASISAGGTPLPGRSASLNQERLLFYLCVTRASERLYLSRPYLDAEGRDNPPSIFWQEVLGLVEAAEADLQRLALGEVCPPLAEARTPAEAALATLQALTSPASQEQPLALALLDTDVVRPRVAQAFRVAEAFRPGAQRLRRTNLMPGERLAVSASLLETYAACPFKCFCAHYLKIAEPPSPAAQRGKRVHALIGEFLSSSEWDGSEAGQEQAWQQLWDIAQRHLPEGGSWEARLEQAWLQTTLRRFLIEEGKRRRTLRGARIYSELVFGDEEGAHAPALALPGPEETRLVVRGRIDRIDLLPFGDRTLAFVVDYKTGPAPGPKEIREGAALQVPLYHLAVARWAERGATPIGGEWYSLRSGAWRRTCFGEQEKAVLEAQGQRTKRGGWEQYLSLEQVISYVSEYVEGLRRGEVRADPRTGACRACTYADVCRIKEAGRVEDEEEE